MQRLALIILTLLLASGCFHVDGQGAGAAGQQRAVSEYDSVIAKVVELRGLKPKRPIRVNRVSNDEFDEVIQRDTLALKKRSPLASRFIQNGPQSNAALVAFYDTVSREIYVRAEQSDWVKENMDPRGLVAHEVAHALQDQHFGYEALYAAKSPDEWRALRGLFEGDAEVTRIVFEAGERKLQPKRTVAREIRELRERDGRAPINGLESPEVAALSPLAREDLTFAYKWGLNFVGSIYVAGGFDLVNRLYAAPPQATAQLYHPESYVAGRNPYDVPAPALPAGVNLVGAGGAIGEFGMRAVMEATGLPKADAIELASGWRGDSIVNFEDSNGQQALIWRVVMDGQQSAQRVASVLGQHDGYAARKGSDVCWVVGVTTKAAEQMIGLAFKQAATLPPYKPPIGRVLLKPLPAPLEENPAFYGRVVGKTYQIDSLGVKMTIPAGYEGAVRGDQGIWFALKRPGSMGLIAVHSQRPDEPVVAAFERGVIAGISKQGPVTDRRVEELETALGKARKQVVKYATTGAELVLYSIPICEREALLAVMMMYPSADTGAQKALSSWLSSVKVSELDKSRFCKAIQNERKVDLP